MTDASRPTLREWGDALVRVAAQLSSWQLFQPFFKRIAFLASAGLHKHHAPAVMLPCGNGFMRNYNRTLALEAPVILNGPV
jgi:hypothetical protein